MAYNLNTGKGTNKKHKKTTIMKEKELEEEGQALYKLDFFKIHCSS